MDTTNVDVGEGQRGGLRLLLTTPATTSNCSRAAPSRRLIITLSLPIIQELHGYYYFCELVVIAAAV